MPVPPVTRSFYDQQVPCHNRWRPDIPPVECREWFDGTIGNNDSVKDVRDVSISMVHPLSGPIAVEGATPGDLRMVNILDLGRVPQGAGPVAGQRWGYTGIFARANGWGYLTDHLPDAYKAVWDFHCQTATSRYLPGVRFTGITHPGIIGTVPSRDLLAHWNTREAEVIATAMSQAGSSSEHHRCCARIAHAPAYMEITGEAPEIRRDPGGQVPVMAAAPSAVSARVPRPGGGVAYASGRSGLIRRNARNAGTSASYSPSNVGRRSA